VRLAYTGADGIVGAQPVSVLSNALEREAAGFGSAETSRRNLAAITCARAAGVEKPLRSGCGLSVAAADFTLQAAKRSSTS